MITSLQRSSIYNKSWRKFSLKKLLVIVLFLVVLISFTNYAYGITVGTLPFEVAINPTTNRAYVSHADSTVHVINTVTNTDIATISITPAGALTGIAVNPATPARIYVANSATSQIAVIDGQPGSPNENTVIATINLAPSGGVFPVDVEVNTVMNTLYVSNILSLRVIVIDLSSNSIIDVIPGFDSPSRFTFDPTTNLMYMTNFFTNQVSVLDGTKSFVGSSGTDSPFILSIPIGNSADGIEINPTNQKIYTANSGDDTVSVIDVNPSSVMYNNLINTIQVGVNPVGVGVDATNNRIYVTNKDEGTLSVIDGSDDSLGKPIPTELASVTVTPRPRGLDVHSGTGNVYVANSGIGLTSGTVSVIDFTANNPPVAKAGDDKVVEEGDSVTLNGAASSDPDDGGLFYTWTHVPPFGPSGMISTSSSTSTSFTAPTVNADELFTFALTVTENTTPFLSSIPDVVNVVVKDKTTFMVPGTLAGGVVSGSQSIVNIFGGSTYALQIVTPPGALPSGELEQLVISTEVSGSVDFDFTESSQIPSGIVEPDTETALFFDLTFGGVDFSQSSNFLSGILPKAQFLIDSAFTSAQSFADGCAVVQIELLNEVSGLWELIGDPQQANTNKIYVSNTPGTLSVIDGSTNNVIDTIPVGVAPKLIGFNENTNKIYVANQGTNTVSVIDGSTNNVIATIDVGLAPVQPVVNPNTGLVYVTNQGSGTVSVIDGSTDTEIVSITPPIPIPTGVTPVGIDIDTTLNKIYVTNNFGSSVSVIDGDPSSGNFNNVIPVPTGLSIPTPLPSGIDIDSSKNLAYVSNFDDRSVSVIDTTSDTTIAVIPVGANPTGLSVNPTTNRLYVTNIGSNTVSIIDTTIRAEIATIFTGFAPFEVDVNPNTNRAYVSNRGSGTVSVIDGMPGSPTENTVIDTITGFSNNFGVTLNPNVPNPVRDPSKDVTGKCAYIAQPPHFSKFAIGGVALALAGGGGGTPGPTSYLGALALSDSGSETISLPPEIRDEINNREPGSIVKATDDIYEEYDFPLSIGEKSFAVSEYAAPIETQTIVPGEPTEFTLVYYTNSEIAHSSLYFNLGPTRSIQGSNTQVLLYQDKPAEIVDPNGNIASATGSINNEGELKRVATFLITFSEFKEFTTSDMVNRAWTTDLNSGDTIFYDAIKVMSPEEEIAFEESLPKPEVEQLKSRYVPIWIKNNAHWWSQELIEDSDFVAGIEYLIQKEIITVSESGNVAAISSDEIPTWIKNNAGWWSEDLITEQEFIDGLQWLISIGVISVGETG